MHRAALALPFAIALSCIACGGSSAETSAGSSSSGSGGGGGSAPTGYKDDMTFTTGKWTTKPGDNFECFYTSAITDHEINVTGALATQGPGGHHVTVYYTTEMQAPTHHTCKDSEMISWTMIAAAQEHNGGEPQFQLPEGLAFKMPPGRQIVLQSHYINTTGKDQVVDDKVTISTTATADVKQFANFWVLFDDKFSVPPHAASTSVMSYELKDPVDLVVMLGHMHQWGTHFSLDTVDAQGKKTASVYESDWNEEFASHPPVHIGTLEKPIHFDAGTRFHQSCSWNNDTSDPITFPREMCLTFGVYFPDAGDMILLDGQAVSSP